MPYGSSMRMFAVRPTEVPIKMAIQKIAKPDFGFQSLVKVYPTSMDKSKAGTAESTLPMWLKILNGSGILLVPANPFLYLCISQKLDVIKTRLSHFTLS